MGHSPVIHIFTITLRICKKIPYGFLCERPEPSVCYLVWLHNPPVVPRHRRAAQFTRLQFINLHRSTSVRIYQVLDIPVWHSGVRTCPARQRKIHGRYDDLPGGLSSNGSVLQYIAQILTVKDYHLACH